jgi:hypothetical protein
MGPNLSPIRWIMGVPSLPVTKPITIGAAAHFKAHSLLMTNFVVNERSEQLTLRWGSFAFRVLGRGVGKSVELTRATALKSRGLWALSGHRVRKSLNLRHFFWCARILNPVAMACVNIFNTTRLTGTP